MPIQPQHPITIVDESDTRIISASLITKELVGEKAYGLSCIPSAWTLPFVVASSKLYEGYSRATPSA
ncbi:hypothetical protein A8E30_08005, partial [Burkholderia cenocepacia]